MFTVCTLVIYEISSLTSTSCKVKWPFSVCLILWVIFQRLILYYTKTDTVSRFLVLSLCIPTQHRNGHTDTNSLCLGNHSKSNGQGPDGLSSLDLSSWELPLCSFLVFSIEKVTIE